MVCGDPRVQRLILQSFIPAAEDEWRFGEVIGWGQKWDDPRTQSPEFQLLTKIVRQGHMQDGVDRFHVQGFYVATPSGTLLASSNVVSEPEQLLKILRQGLAQWQRLPPRERLLPEPPDPKLATIGGAGAELFPADGLALRVVTRSLPHPRFTAYVGTSHPKYYRLDHAWFRKDEARSFLPDAPAVGGKHTVPVPLVERLAAFHLGTNVDGASGIRKETIKEARLEATVRAVTDGVVQLELEGATWTDGWSWTARNENVGYRCTLLGHAVYDLGKDRFTAFELVAVGMRTFGREELPAGAPNPMPLGVVLRLAENTPAGRQPPKFLKAYGW